MQLNGSIHYLVYRLSPWNRRRCGCCRLEGHARKNNAMSNVGNRRHHHRKLWAQRTLQSDASLIIWFHFYTVSQKHPKMTRDITRKMWQKLCCKISCWVKQWKNLRQSSINFTSYIGLWTKNRGVVWLTEYSCVYAQHARQLSLVD